MDLDKLKEALDGLANFLKTKFSAYPTQIIQKTDKPLGLLIPFAKAIQTFEGYYPNSTSYRNNNPGNLRYSQYCVNLGATGRSPANFAIFPSYEVGFKALCQFLTDAAENKLKIGQNLTLQQFMDKYAPSSDGNNPQKYASFIAKNLGVTVDFPISKLI